MKIPVRPRRRRRVRLLRFRRANLLTWAGAWWVGIYVAPPVRIHGPDSRLGRHDLHGHRLAGHPGVRVVQRGAPRGSVAPARPVHDREALHARSSAATIVAIPALAAANVYVQMNVPLQPPLFSRTVHPASPSEITVHDKKIDLDTGENPFRQLETSNPAEFRSHVENGRRVFYRNCVFCHGDNLAGNGMFVHGLDPIPTNFTDKGTIAMLRETFLFWRISKGGPGLPEEGGPWDTAMPAWEKFLKEDEIWDVDPLSLRHHGPEASRQGGGRGEMTSRRIGPRASRDVARVSRCTWSAGYAPRRRVPCAPRLPTSAPRRSASRARSSISRTVRSATATRGTVRGMRPRICAPGRATSRPASSRCGRRRTARSRRIRISSTSSGAACPTPRCRPGPISPIRKSRTSRTSSRPSRPDFSNADNAPTARFASERPEGDEGVNRAREEALRGDRLRQVPRHARSGRRTVGPHAGGRLGTSDTRRRISRRAGPCGEVRPARTSSGR